MLNFFFYLVIFVFGLIIGSFLNCLIYRIKEKESFFVSRSFCPYCRHTLSWQDLIPVLSFLILKGKCRYCQKPISWQYPIVEISTAILFLIPLIYGSPTSIIWSDLFVYWIFACFLIIIFVYDLKHYIIPDEVIYPAIGISLIYNIFYSLFKFHDFYFLINTVAAAALAAAFFLFIVLISRGKWMGVGDIKLAFFMGLVLGWPNILVALFLAFFVGAATGVGLIIAGKKRLSSKVPFGPFLVSGTFLAIFFGENLINWYLSLISF